MSLKPDFAAGQLWTYRGAGCEASRVVVGKIDVLDGPQAPTVLSISVIEVRLLDPEAGLIKQRDIYHCPISVETLSQSVVALVGAAAPAEGFEEGYESWRQGVSNGEAGYFTIPVNEIVELYRDTLGLVQSSD